MGTVASARRSPHAAAPSPLASEAPLPPPAPLAGGAASKPGGSAAAAAVPGGSDSDDEWSNADTVTWTSMATRRRTRMNSVVTGVDGVEKALRRLAKGNARMVAAQQTHPNSSKARREELVTGQSPWAIILSCSDSRVPPELVFDQGFGDLFCVRVAGGCLMQEALGTIEFAVEAFGCHLVVVLGHERCAAVTIASSRVPVETIGAVHAVIDCVKPSIAAARARVDEFASNDEYVCACVREGSVWTAKAIMEAEPILTREIRSGALRVVPAYFHMESGVVEFLPPPMPTLKRGASVSKLVPAASPSLPAGWGAPSDPGSAPPLVQVPVRAMRGSTTLHHDAKCGCTAGCGTARHGG